MTRKRVKISEEERLTEKREGAENIRDYITNMTEYWKKPSGRKGPYSEGCLKALDAAYWAVINVIDDLEAAISAETHRPKSPAQSQPRIVNTNYFGLRDGPRTELTQVHLKPQCGTDNTD